MFKLRNRNQMKAMRKNVSILHVRGLFVLRPRSGTEAWMHLDGDPVFYLNGPVDPDILGSEIIKCSKFSSDFSEPGWPKGVDFQKAHDKYEVILDGIEDKTGLKKGKIYKEVDEISIWLDSKLIKFEFIVRGKNIYDTDLIVDESFFLPKLSIGCSDRDVGQVVLDWVDRCASVRSQT